MTLKMIQNNRFLALLLTIDGILNGLFFQDILFVIPFIVAAVQFFLSPHAWKLLRWLILFAAIAVAISLQSAAVFIVEGYTLGLNDYLFQGVSLVVVNAIILIGFIQILRNQQSSLP